MNHKKPIDISIIIPVYNTASYLAECLDSILAQTIKNIEIICVNDGSTDDSLSILQNYKNKDPRIIIISQQNSGVSMARNAGIAASSGKYVAFVDSDDVVDPDFCEQMYTIAEKDSCEVVNFFPRSFLCEAIRRYPYVKRLLKKYPDKDKIELRSPTTDDRIFLVYFSGGFCRSLFNRDFLEQYNLRFPVGIHFGEDQVFTWRVFTKVHKMTLFEANLYHYRRREGSALRKAVVDTKGSTIDDILVTYCQMKDYYLSSPETKSLTQASAVIFLRQTRNINLSSTARAILVSKLDKIVDDYLLTAIRTPGFLSFTTRMVWAQHYAQSSFGKAIAFCGTELLFMSQRLENFVRRRLRPIFFKKKWN